MTKTKKGKLIALVCAAVLVVIDQLLKKWVLATLPGAGRVEVVRGLFYLTYVENRGAAFGIFQGKTMILSVLTGIVLLAILIFLLSSKASGGLLTATLTLILAGGVGNLIDRVTQGFVVDYLDFSAIFGFPVFNFADCCVVVGTILLLCWFVWSERKQEKPGQPPENTPQPGSEGSEA